MPDAASVPPPRPRRICLTGGGTAGHVTPHFALLPGLRARGWEVFYIGGNGLEKDLVRAAGVDFRQISTGKLRRYFSLQNALDVFKVFLGCLQALGILLGRRPDVVFSKGGFVAVPVAVAAWLLRIPVVSHESDLTPGLANRLIAPLARKIVYTFADTARHLPASAVRVGSPVRAELFLGDKVRGARFCGFDAVDDRFPTLLVMGGSQGAQKINAALLELLPWLMERARVVHLTGKGKALHFTHPRYRGFEYVSAELSDVFALVDSVVSRAGANSIFEFVALGKPMLLIPLEQGSRGDQVLNAEAFVKSGWAALLREKDLTAASFRAALLALEAEAPAMRARQATFAGRDAADRILAELDAIVAARPT